MADYTFNVTNGRTMDQFSEVTSPNANDTLWIMSGGSLKKIQAQNLVSALTNITYSGAGAHNAICRGINLGTALTETQTSAIAAGTFDGMYIGDYWTINNVTYRIAAFDYYWNTGDKACTTHHVVIVPDAPLSAAKMNETNTTVGAYVGSEMYTTGLSQAKATITAAFGSAHLLTHRNILQNACANGAPTGTAWFDSTVEIMNEQNVYGSQIIGAFPVNGTGTNYLVDNTQFPLFIFRPDLISNRKWSWLRDIASATSFAQVDNQGGINYSGASYTSGVRPAFAIC